MAEFLPQPHPPDFPEVCVHQKRDETPHRNDRAELRQTLVTMVAEARAPTFPYFEIRKLFIIN